MSGSSSLTVTTTAVSGYGEQIKFGYGVGGTAVVTLNDYATLNLTGGPYLQDLMIGCAGGTGITTVQDNASVTVSGGLYVGQNGGSSGAVKMFGAS